MYSFFSFQVGIAGSPEGKKAVSSFLYLYIQQEFSWLQSISILIPACITQSIIWFGCSYITRGWRLRLGRWVCQNNRTIIFRLSTPLSPAEGWRAEGKWTVNTFRRWDTDGWTTVGKNRLINSQSFAQWSTAQNNNFLSIDSVETSLTLLHCMHK